MTKTDFYRDKRVITTDWWLDSCSFPRLAWARLRVFNDNTADACFGEDEKLFGFLTGEYAGYFLAEDEFVRLAAIDREDEFELDISLTEIQTPLWSENPKQSFEYLGTY